MSKPSVYNMYLTTINQDGANIFDPPITPTNKTRPMNITWSMNWDALFKNNNKNGKYEKCRVRYDLRSALYSSTIATGIAYQSGNELTVDSITGTLAPLATVTLSTTTETIVSFGTGTGGIGTYIMDTSATIGSAGSPVAFNAFTNWNLQSGYLVCNLQSNKSLSATHNGTVLGIVTPSLNPVTSSSHVYLSSSIQTKGVDIIIPQGSSPFTLSFINFTTGQFMFSQTTFNYEIMLYFELYN